jgi:UDP-glucose 4-epimerase
VKLVVTGALGHIGSRLVRDLAAAHPGAEILLVDNLSTQRFPSLFGLPERARFRFVEGDVRALDLAPLLSGAAAVVHLAALTDPAASLGEDAFVRHNLDATRAVASASAAAGAPLIFASTTSVYGPRGDRAGERSPDEDLRPQSPYAASKLREERLLAATPGLRFTTLRLGTIVGASPGMRFHTAVNRFCFQAATGAPLTVWRTALHQLRPYLALADATRAVAELIRMNRFAGSVFDAVTVHATVAEVIEALRAHLPDLSVTLVDSPLMNELSFRVDGDGLRALGIEFTGSIREGVAETLALLGRLR